MSRHHPLDIDADDQEFAASSQHAGTNVFEVDSGFPKQSSDAAAIHAESLIDDDDSQSPDESSIPFNDEMSSVSERKAGKGGVRSYFRVERERVETGNVRGMDDEVGTVDNSQNEELVRKL